MLAGPMERQARSLKRIGSSPWRDDAAEWDAAAGATARTGPVGASPAARNETIKIPRRTAPAAAGLLEVSSGSLTVPRP